MEDGIIDSDKTWVSASASYNMYKVNLEKFLSVLVKVSLTKLFKIV